MSIIIESKFTGNTKDLENAANAWILILRALGALPSTPESEKLAKKIKFKNTSDRVS